MRTGARLEIRAPEIAGELTHGQSVSVNGACLTVVSCAGAQFAVETMGETLSRTNLGTLAPGRRVNLERAMRFDSRLDGHLVAGHVDATGRVDSLEEGTFGYKVWVACEEEWTDLIVPKGSVCLNGVSLTVIDALRGRFSTGLIPTTRERTTFSDIREGDVVNIETDMVGKYIARLVRAFDAPERDERKSVTWDKLLKYGWGSEGACGNDG